jgi:hypothetical protein
VLAQNGGYLKNNTAITDRQLLSKAKLGYYSFAFNLPTGRPKHRESRQYRLAPALPKFNPICGDERFSCA